jgi:hypothetical protein
MALSANQSYTFNHSNQQRFLVAASQTIYKGAAVGVRNSDGKAREWDGTTGDKFVGFAARKVVTNSSGYVTLDGVPAGYNDSSTESGYVTVMTPDSMLENVAITGLSLQTDLLEPVWMTDDGTFTLTPQADDTPVGFVVYVRSTTSGTGDIAVYNFAAMQAEMQVDGGWRKDTLVAGIANTGFITTTYVDAVTDLPMHGAGRITKLYVITGRKSSGHTGAVKFKLRLNGTFLKNTAGTFIFQVTGTNMKTHGSVNAINIAHSTTYSAKFGPGDLVRVRVQCATAPTNGNFSVVALSARRLMG